MELRKAEPRDLDAVLALLAAAALPTADVARHFDHFVVLDESGVVGVAGLEVHDAAALVRSVCVDASRRGRGLGGQLCDAVEARALDLGVRDLYLLTTTAAPFFEARGYVRVARNRAPETIRATEEFRSLCPDSAACLHRRLSARPPRPA